MSALLKRCSNLFTNHLVALASLSVLALLSNKLTLNYNKNRYLMVILDKKFRLYYYNN